MPAGVFPNQVVFGDGFGPPALGGAVNVLFASFNSATTGIASGVTLFTIPQNAEIVGYLMNTNVAWNGTGTNTIDFGTTGALTQFAAAQNAGATGQKDDGFVPTQLFVKQTGPVPFTARYNGTTATLGTTFIAVFYITR